ncbi:MAG: hypothetical protein ACM3Q1_16945 [Bacteroidales bacterium]
MSDNHKSETVWAVRGIPEEVRRAVVGRAKSEGRTVGAWVSEALRRALDGQDDISLAEQLDELRRRVDTLEQLRHG